jgi:hypothetical protein
MYLTINRQERCVMARIRRQRQLHQANFTLREYGSWAAAKVAAAKWVNNLARNLPPPLTSKDCLTSRNQSGVVGVFRHREVHRKVNGRNAVYYSWVARWPGCKSSGGIKWSVKRFGEDDGFVLAVLSRRLESDTRERVLAALKEAKDTNEYARLLALRKR